MECFQKLFTRAIISSKRFERKFKILNLLNSSKNDLNKNEISKENKFFRNFKKETMNSQLKDSSDEMYDDNTHDNNNNNKNTKKLFQT